MREAAKAQEPSMEDILASIRRIIADDDPAKGSNGAGEAAESAPPPEEETAVAKAPAAEPAEAAGDNFEAMLGRLDAEIPAGGPDNPEASAEDATHDPADVLELTPAMEARKGERPGLGQEARERETPVPVFRVIDAKPDVAFSEATSPESEPARLRTRAAGERAMSERDGAPSLLSERATAAVTSAFGSLAHTVLTQNARTLEDLVGEMLRPMLKAWLDDNLPVIVERLVRAEIERVSRGRT